jgi:hypothetical protein
VDSIGCVVEFQSPITDARKDSGEAADLPDGRCIAVSQPGSVTRGIEACQVSMDGCHTPADRRCEEGGDASAALADELHAPAGSFKCCKYLMRVFAEERAIVGCEELDTVRPRDSCESRCDEESITLSDNAQIFGLLLSAL